MTIKKTLRAIVLTGVLAFNTILCGCSKPEIRKYKDMTGDGIKDVLIYVDNYQGKIRGNYLFIGKEDDTFIRTKERKHEYVKYFLSDDGTAYFFDGRFYRPSPKQK